MQNKKLSYTEDPTNSTGIQSPMHPVLTFKTPDVYSHNPRLPQIDLDVMSIKKNETPHHVVRGKFKNLIAEKYGNHKIIFTDGSKNEGGVGSAAVMDTNRETVSLPLASTVFTSGFETSCKDSEEKLSV